MKYKKIPFLLSEVSVFFTLLVASPAIGQIVPDSTLPSKSKVTEQGNVTLIEGGTRAGKNLFHSFKELSVPSIELP